MYLTCRHYDLIFARWLLGTAVEGSTRTHKAKGQLRVYHLTGWPFMFYRMQNPRVDGSPDS